jgi:hypothetical protein
VNRDQWEKEDSWDLLDLRGKEARQDQLVRQDCLESWVKEDPLVQEDFLGRMEQLDREVHKVREETLVLLESRDRQERQEDQEIMDSKEFGSVSLPSKQSSLKE